MATTESILESTDFLQPTGFKVIVVRKRFKNLEFFAQSVQHPDVSVSAAIAPYKGSNLQIPGDKLEYGSLSIDVIIDENMNVYKEMISWLESTVRNNYTTPSRVTQSNQDVSAYDIKLAILSSHNNIIDTITYKDAFPTNIGSINLQANVDGINFITCPITFNYTTFEITQ